MWQPRPMPANGEGLALQSRHMGSNPIRFRAALRCPIDDWFGPVVCTINSEMAIGGERPKHTDAFLFLLF